MRLVATMNPPGKTPASFLALRTQVDKEDDQTLTPNHRQSLHGLLTQRDDIITLLARGDAAGYPPAL